MSGRYALLAAALLAPGLASAQSQWSYLRAASFPLVGADTVKARPFLATTSADGSLYLISSRATDTLAHNAVWKLAQGGTQLTLVDDLFSDANVNSVRGIASIGNDVLITTNTKPVPSGPGIGAIYVYPGGSTTGRAVFQGSGYGTFPYGIAATKNGYVYAALSFLTGFRAYDFTPGSANYGKWIVQDPSVVSEKAGHDQCALSQLRDVAVNPTVSYNTASQDNVFYTTRNATPSTAPDNCVRYGGTLSAWSGGTASAWKTYTSEPVTSLDGAFSLTSYVAPGITVDKAGTVYLAGPDSSRRFVKGYSVTGTFAFEDDTKRFPSKTTPLSGEAVANGAPFRAPVDVAISADERFAYVIDRDARKVFVFANNLIVSAEKGAEATGLFLAAPGPNPVRGETTLRFALRESGPAVLAVYDALGREVSRLVDGMTAAGEQSVTFDASALAPGLYLVRLDANGAHASQTLVRIR